MRATGTYPGPGPTLPSHIGLANFSPSFAELPAVSTTQEMCHLTGGPSPQTGEDGGKQGMFSFLPHDRIIKDQGLISTEAELGRTGRPQLVFLSFFSAAGKFMEHEDAFE